MSGWEPSDWNSGGALLKAQEAQEAPPGDKFYKNAESPIFGIDILERNAARGHGLVTSVAAGNNVLLVGTNRGWIVRHDFGAGETVELDLSTRGTDQWVQTVSMDPGGRHGLATIFSNAGADTYYIHGKWRKPRVLSKLKNITVSSVAWNRQQINEAFTRDVILGTTKGELFETAIEEKDKKEKYVKQLFAIGEMPEPFIGVQMETVTTGHAMRYFVMATTPTRLYVFVGTGSLEAVFAAYASSTPHFTELPGELPKSELHFYGKQRRSERFAWLAGPGIYHGHLNLGAQPSANQNHGDESNVENKWLLEYSKFAGDEGSAKPCSLALTDFHFLVLFGNNLKVVNRVSQKVVQEERFDNRLDLGSPNMLGLCSDGAAGAFYAFDENSIFEITVQDEGRDMWQVYLSLKEYAAALEHCPDPIRKDYVYAAQAEAAFDAGDYSRAASFYAKTTTVATFETVALKFITVSQPDALRTFLLRKLDFMGKEDRSQITMISTWAAELYLDKINRLLLGAEKENEGQLKEEDSSTIAEYQSTVREFRAFLNDCKDVLDEATTVKLLGSYGRVEELVYFASLKEHYETLIHHYIQQGEAKKALAVFRKPTVSPELQYKFAPALIMLDPHETVESWTLTGFTLNPRRLIPALMRYSCEPRARDEPNAAIRYLEYCIQRQQNQDSTVHNLLLSLYAKQADETVLLRFLDAKHGKGRLDGPDYFYDPKYALRLCLEEKCMRACVFIYGMMGMHEEAVALALQVDLEMAKLEADKVEDNEELRKKLWLMIAKHVVQQGKATKGENIRKAIAFLRETDGLLKIEDILPFFPDFSLIDDFKEAICTSLEDYNRQIEELKRDMNDATQGADNIRSDISALSQRYAVVKRDETCGVCGQRILASRGSHGALGVARGYTSLVAPFYVFPCEHAFHAQCLTDYVIKLTDKSERDRIIELLRCLMSLGNQEVLVRAGGKASHSGRDADPEAADGRIVPVDQLRAQLDDAVAGECPFCGELMIRQIAQPFISSEETDLVSSWAIDRQELALF